MLSRKKDEKFEIQFQQDGRWVIDSIETGKDDAIQHARKVLSAAKYRQVRVVQLRGSRENVVFEEQREAQRSTLKLQTIESAPPCTDVWDLYKAEARLAAGRLLRSFFDEQVITSSEFLHGRAYLKQFNKLDAYFSSALYRVAGLQAGDLGVSPTQRFDDLYKLYEAALERSGKEDDRAELLKLAMDEGWPAALSKIAADWDAREAPYVVTGVAADYLRGAGDWTQKVQFVEKALRTADGDAATIALFDEILVEIVDGSAALMSLLGRQADLGSALVTIAELSQGTHVKQRHDPAGLAELNDALAAYDLPRTVASLIDRLARELSGTKRLTLSERRHDQRVFEKLVNVLATDAGLRGGPVCVTGLVRRAQLTYGEDFSDLAATDAIKKLLSLLPTPAVELGTLLDLARTDFGRDNLQTVMGLIAHFLSRIESVEDLLGRDIPIKALPNILNELIAKLRDNSVLPDGVVQPLIARLEKLKSNPVPARKSGDEAQPADQPSTRANGTPPPHARSKPAGPAAKAPPGGVVLQAGDTLFKRGDRAECAYILASGKVRVCYQLAHGPVEEICESRGELFGEVSLIDGGVHTASVVALSESTFQTVPIASVRRKLDALAKSDRFLHKLVEGLAGRLRGLQDPSVSRS